MTQAIKNSVSSPSSTRERLRNIIVEKSFKTGTFQLASGKSSSYYFNLKPTLLDPEGINLVSDLLLEHTARIDAHYIGGLVMGAVPILMAAIVKSYQTASPLKGFWIRKAAKDHGTQSLFDGYLIPGEKVIVVEDVTTSGGSILQAITEIKKQGCDIAAAFTIVDRLEGAKERLAQERIDLIPFLTLDDFRILQIKA